MMKKRWTCKLRCESEIGKFDATCGPPIRYPAVAAALVTVGDRALENGASVHMPRIGCGLAGGKWEQIEPLILAALSARGVAVTVYDLGGNK